MRILFLFAACSILLSGICIHASAQSRPYQIAIVAPVTLGVAAEYYCKKTGADGRWYIISDSLKIYAVKPGQSLQADDLYQVGAPLQTGAWQHIEFRGLVSDTAPSWQLLTSIDTGGIQGILLKDIVLKSGESLRLQFRDKVSGQLLQQCMFERPAWVPELAAWRQYHSNDPEEKKYSGHLLQQQADSGLQLPPGFNSFRLVPGKQTDLLLLKKGLNRDSSMEYRLLDMNDTTQGSWRLSGHLLSLPGLPGNRNYVLQLRYRGMETASYFYLITSPYWYQQWKLLLGIFLLLMIAILILFYYWKRYHAKQELNRRRKLENSLTVMHHQLNPHFIFNSFSSITNLINTGNSERASQYLATFSGMMRHTMTVSDLPVISLADDIDQMEQYLRIEQLRFGFCFCIEISPRLNLQQIELPPQLLQPSIENAVKHGASGLKEDGRVILRIFDNDSNLYIQVYNNSRPNIRRKMEGQGYGLKFTREQVKNLQELYRGNKIAYELQIDEAGATAAFFFENWLKPEA